MKRWLAAMMVVILFVYPMLLPPKAYAAGTMFTSVASQLNTTMALDANGQIWAWGSNISGQFGDGTNVSSHTPKKITVMDNGATVTFKEVKPSFDSALALDTSGQLWSTGDNGKGQLGLGTGTASTMVWTKVEVMDGGTAVTFKKIAALRYTSLALDSNGKLWIWGFRTWTPDPYVPSKMGFTDGNGDPVVFETLEGNEENGIAIDSTQHIWEIFNSQYMPSRLSVFDGAAEAEFQSIAVGAGYGTGTFLIIAIDNIGNVWTWGGNDQGQLGDGQVSGDRWFPEKNPVLDSGNPVKFAQVSGGNKHVLALDENGDMWTWGMNAAGQLGDGTTINSAPHKVAVSDNGTSFQFVSLTAGFEVSYGLDQDGRLWSWGKQYMLGDGGNGSGAQATPEKIFLQPTVTLQTSVASSTYLQPITLTASVIGDFDTPTGNVEFRDGGLLLGTSSLAANGTATLTVSSLQPGTHAFTAHYAGDDFYLARTTSNLAFQVTMPDAPVISITPSTTAQTNDPITLNVTASTYGIGNSLFSLKWLPGDHGATAFAGAGTDILAAGSFDVASNGSYTVHAKDWAGNETVKKIEVVNIVPLPNDSLISPLAASFDKYTGEVANMDVATGLTLNGNTLSSIANGAAALAPGTDYTVTGSTVTILKAYLMTQPVGTTSLTFTFSGGADQTLTIAIGDSTPSPTPTPTPSATPSPTPTATPIPSQNPASTSSNERPNYQIVTDSSGKVVIIVAPSVLATEKKPDGTNYQKLIVPESILNQAAGQLKDTANPIILIRIDNKESAVQVQLPASSIAAIAKSFPNAVIEVELKGSSMQLKSSVLDLENLAKRLGVSVSDLKINSTMEQVSDTVRNELMRVGNDKGFSLLGSVIDFQVTAEANGQTVDIGDFGGMYMVQAIVFEQAVAGDLVFAVHYDPVTRQVSYIPTQLGARNNGSKEAVMRTPHQSIYAVIRTDGPSFADMQGHWAKAEVEQLAARFIVNGISAERFAPNDSITRAEFASLLVRSMGISLEHDSAYKGFTDIASTAWYASEVEAAVRAGLVQGLTSERFGPNERISREQMAVMIARALTIVSKDGTEPVDSGAQVAFADKDLISPWAETAVAETAKAGIITGMDGQAFAPKDSATRAQAAVMLNRFLQAAGFIS
ncbi:Alpha-tubulin suppressor [Paenibacillus algorifonticola]|uniref:Alpha-tubulin suppressor n=1 Tax=Paenibacillus algorifonticola TaxID=684063 RepID=A0A1I2FR68_9BACL|nr:S-layer homology domain-containing protein [Paenibacillus algorifonticola]SFF07795.1 Alpha-tubulin suppressor [Paenibacillus algorifonticola]